MKKKIQILFLIVLIANTMYAASCPISLSAGPDQTVCGSVVSLHGVLTEGSGPLSAVKWTSAGGGSFSNPFSLSSSYIASASEMSAGKAVLTLSVTNCIFPLSDQVIITLLPPMKVTLTATSTAICVGGSVFFTANAQGATSYVWQLNGVTIGNSNSGVMSKLFSVAGSQTMTVIATNANGCTASNTIIITVSPNPNVTITYPSNNICAGIPVTFSGYVDGGVSYVWKVNGIVVPNATTTSLTYTFSTSGNQQVALVGKNSNGCTGSKTIQVTVNSMPAPVITASVSTATGACVGAPVTFTMTSPGAVDFAWYVNLVKVNGNTSTLTYTFNTTGVQSIIGYAMNATGCTGSTGYSLQVNSLPAPVITASVSPATGACIGAPVTFTMTSPGAVDFAWYVNLVKVNGNTSALTYTFNTTGVQSIIGYAMNATGCTGSTSYSLQVNSLPVISLTASSNQACVGDTVKFVATAPASGYFYSWAVTGENNFNGGNKLSFSHPFDNPGMHNVTFTATNNSSKCSASKSYPVVINALPDFTLTISSDTICIGDSATFTVNPPGLFYAWRFDGTLINTGTSTIFTLPDGVSNTAGTHFINVSGTISSSQCTSYRNQSFMVKNCILPPQIITFAPASGPVGATVTIVGKNFNNIAANNIVFFGATRATVTNATPTQLIVAVPAGATYQPISVLNMATALTGYSAKPFIVTGGAGQGQAFISTSFKPSVNFITGSFPGAVACGDLDGDGKPDMVTVNHPSNGISTSSISVYRNTTAVGSINATSFAAKVDFIIDDNLSIYDNPVSIAFGDFDLDGKPDLAISSGSGVSSGSVSVLRNTSTPGSITFASRINFPIGTSAPHTVVVLDMDGDGKPDLAVIYENGVVSVLRNTSTPGTITATSFSTGVSFNMGGGAVAIGDLDGDDKPDLVMTSGNSVSVFRNTAVPNAITPSSFAPKVDFAVSKFPHSLAIGDLDGDAKPDLAVGCLGSNTISVLRNTATTGVIDASSFSAKVDFATVPSPYSVIIADLNGDGKSDLAVASEEYQMIGGVHRNVASPGIIDSTSFSAHVDFPPGSQSLVFAVSDLDDDGSPDIVAVNDFVSSTVSVFRNVFHNNLVTPASNASLRKMQDDHATKLEANNDGFSAFPNPTTGRLLITLPVLADAYITITDVYGQILIKHTCHNTAEAILDLSDVAKGVHLLWIRQNDLQKCMRIVVK